MTSTHVWKLRASEIGALLGRNKYTSTSAAVAGVFERHFKVRWQRAKDAARVEDPAILGRAALRSCGAAKQAIADAIRAATPETTSDALQCVHQHILHAHDGHMTRARRKLVEPVAKAATDVARRLIYTEIGKHKEDAGLDAHARATGRKVGRRNDSFYKLEGPGYVVWGMIDGYDESTRTVIEHKQRQNRLFRGMPAYERVQCFLYMKMTDSARATLVQTWGEDQSSFQVAWDDAEWEQIALGIDEAVQNLEQLRTDPATRVELARAVYPPIPSTPPAGR